MEEKEKMGFRISEGRLIPRYLAFIKEIGKELENPFKGSMERAALNALEMIYTIGKLANEILTLIPEDDPGRKDCITDVEVMLDHGFLLGSLTNYINKLSDIKQNLEKTK